MTCKECGCLSSSFDERLGETVCDSCGLVEISHFIEDTVSNWKADNTGRLLGSQILQFGKLRETNVRYNNSINMSNILNDS